MDALYWSPRWKRMAIHGDTTLIMFNMHAAYEPNACDTCTRPASSPPALDLRQYSIVEFECMARCPKCGSPLNGGTSQMTLLNTDDEEYAESQWAEYEAQLIAEELPHVL